MKYPDGTTYNPKQRKVRKSKAELSLSSANRGMNLEDDINISNTYYLDKGIAVITKRPTPINVVKVDYSRGARIIDAYYEKQSTTDYNGVYKGRYIDFEAKNTRNKTSFPIANITKHQIEHLKNVIHHGGIAFFVIEFQLLKEVYLLDAQFVIDFYEHGERKSIPYDVFTKEGVLLKQGYNPPIDYIPAVEEKYFHN